MDDNKKKDKKPKKKETTTQETKQEMIIEEQEQKDEKKEVNDDTELAHNFEVEDCRMHENEYPQSNDLVYVIIKVIVVFSY
jgi:hypothetical protein